MGKFEVAAVHRVTSLETDDGFPVIFFNKIFCFLGGPSIFDEVVVFNVVNFFDTSAVVPDVSKAENYLDVWVVIVVRAVYFFAFVGEVWFIAGLNFEGGDGESCFIAEGEVGFVGKFFVFFVGDWEDDWHGPEFSVSKARIFDDVVVVVFVKESFEGGESAEEEHF